MNNRIREYDYIRALAVILVIAGHALYTSPNSPYGGISIDVSKGLVHDWLNDVRDWIFVFHMPLFFALSGAVFAYGLSRRGLPRFKSFAKGKAKRLLVPFLLVNILYVVPLKLFSGYFDASYAAGGVIGVLHDILIGHFSWLIMNHLWFLASLFWIFMMAWGIERSGLSRHRVVFVLALMCVWMMMMKNNEVTFPYKFGVPRALINLPWFYLGYALELNRDKVNSFITKYINWGGGSRTPYATSRF